MTTNVELHNWAKKRVPGFIGVFAADRLPDMGEGSLIVNYDPASLPGSHWCGIIISSQQVSWFDSFGLPTDADDLILGHRTGFHKWLVGVCQRFGLETYSWNTADLQDLASDNCGLYALWFVKYGLGGGWLGWIR